MQTRTYGELFKTASALIGTGGQLATGEQDQLRHFINRRFQQAFDESPVWPRYLVSSEARDINSHTLSGATASTATAVNQNYRLLGVNDGDIGKEGTNVYIGVTTASGLIYKSKGNAWLVVTGGASAVNADGTIDITTAGTTQFTEADTNKKDTLESVEVWTPRAGSDVLSIVAKNLIPYAQTNKNRIGDFNRIHRKQAFMNNSSIEYEFFVDFDGANLLNVQGETTSAFVSYKKQFTPYTVTSDYYNSTLKVPGEFFNYIAHAVYADFLRVQNRQEEAMTEEAVAQNYLFLELEKIDLRSNNNTINKRFSTYVNRQAR